jgi:N-acetylglucosamine malate deacetylase 1
MKIANMILALFLYFGATIVVSAQTDASKIQLHVIIIGAHPDDVDLKAGGIAAKYVALGHKVRLVSMTNGDAGHFEMSGSLLAKRRKDEAHRAGGVIDSEYIVLDNHDGELMPTLETRRQVIRLIREFQADMVFTHRTNDYHPDHRYTGVLVQDAIQQVVVGPIVPEIPPLEEMPVLMYMGDTFTKPNPFDADIVVAIDDVIEKKIDMIHCHESQMYESNVMNLKEIPENEGERRALLGQRLKRWAGGIARFEHEKLVELYGEERGAEILYAEGFEISEYGRRIEKEDYPKFFPFFD